MASSDQHDTRPANMGRGVSRRVGALLAALLVLAAIATAGCGGDEERVAELEAALSSAEAELDEARAARAGAWAREDAEAAGAAAAEAIAEWVPGYEPERPQAEWFSLHAEAEALSSQLVAVQEDLTAAEARVRSLGGIATDAAPAPGGLAAQEFLALIVLGPADLPPGMVVAEEIYRTESESGFARLTRRFDPGQAAVGAPALLGFAAAATAHTDAPAALTLPQAVRDVLADDAAGFFGFIAGAAGISLSNIAGVEIAERPEGVGDASVTWLMWAETARGPVAAAYALVVVGPYVGAVALLAPGTELDRAGVTWLLEVFALKLATAPGVGP